MVPLSFYTVPKGIHFDKLGVRGQLAAPRPLRQVPSSPLDPLDELRAIRLRAGKLPVPMHGTGGQQTAKLSVICYPLFVRPVSYDL